jgi:hypothetical protein
VARQLSARHLRTAGWSWDWSSGIYSILGSLYHANLDTPLCSTLTAPLHTNGALCFDLNSRGLNKKRQKPIGFEYLSRYACHTTIFLSAAAPLSSQPIEPDPDPERIPAPTSSLEKPSSFCITLLTMMDSHASASIRLQATAASKALLASPVSACAPDAVASYTGSSSGSSASSSSEPARREMTMRVWAGKALTAPGSLYKTIVITPETSAYEVSAALSSSTQS